MGVFPWAKHHDEITPIRLKEDMNKLWAIAEISEWNSSDDIK